MKSQKLTQSWRLIKRKKNPITVGSHMDIKSFILRILFHLQRKLKLHY